MRDDLLGDEGEVVQVSQVQDLEVGARGAELGERPQPGDDLVGRAGGAVGPQLVGLAADGGGSPLDLRLVGTDGTSYDVDPPAGITLTALGTTDAVTASALGGGTVR